MLGIKIQPFLLSVLMLLLTFSLQAQEVSFEATTDAREVVENNSFSVVFTLRNAEGSGFRPPAFDGFRVLRGPNRSVSTQISNGVVRSEKSYTYTLLARGEGTYTIGPASILVNGKKLTTEPVQVKVVKGKEGVEKDLNQVTVRVIPSVVDAVVGQQIIIDYKLYTTVNVDSYNVIEESDYQGFFAQDIKRFDSRVIREVEDGVQYVTKVLKRVALFPQQAGALTIEPMLIQIGIVEDDDPARRRSMFFNRNIKRTAIETEPLTINVSSLPGDAPATFSGAVGQYQVSSRLNRKMMTTDDVLSVRIAVQGNGDVKRIQPPELNLPEGFDAYDPKVKDESAYEINGEIVGKKEFEYLVLPKKPGTYNIAPAFTFYNPDSAKYVTIEDDVFPLNVRQGSMVATDRPALEEEEATIDDIEFIMLNTALYPKQSSPFIGSLLFWLLSVLPLLLLGGIWLFKRSRDADLAMDPALKRQKKARKAAEKRLETANQHLKAEKSRAFYDEVSKAMLDYVCDKLQIPRSELTKENLREKLQNLKVEESRIDRFMKIIHNCEIALFAGKDNSEAMNETYENCVDTIASIEAHLSK